MTSDGATPPTRATNILEAREGRAAAGLPMLPNADRVRYDETAKDLREHCETRGSRDADEAAKRFKHLDGFFLGRRLASIGGADVAAYVAHRQKEEVAHGSINRELTVLNKMLHLAYENGKFLRQGVSDGITQASLDVARRSPDESRQGDLEGLRQVGEHGQGWILRASF